MYTLLNVFTFNFKNPHKSRFVYTFFVDGYF